jgi:hypothetical protein
VKRYKVKTRGQNEELVPKKPSLSGLCFCLRQHRHWLISIKPSVQRLIAKMAILNTLLHITNFKTPLARTVVPAVALAFGIQTAFAIPSIAAQSERFYDLSGSLTYISCAALSLYLPALRAKVASQTTNSIPWLSSVAGQSLLNWRQVALTAAVGFWAARRKAFPSQTVPFLFAAMLWGGGVFFLFFIACNRIRIARGKANLYRSRLFSFPAYSAGWARLSV